MERGNKFRLHRAIKHNLVSLDCIYRLTKSSRVSLIQREFPVKVKVHKHELSMAPILALHQPFLQVMFSHQVIPHLALFVHVLFHSLLTSL